MNKKYFNLIKKIFAKAILIAAIFILSFNILIPQASANVAVTQATGGNNISSDNVGGLYTTLTGPIITESTVGEISLGTIILNAPTGFQFRTSNNVTVTRTNPGNCNGGSNRVLNLSNTSITPTASTITINVSQVSAGNANLCKGTLTFNNIAVRPTSGNLTSGNITKSGTSTIAGVVNNSTNFGTLTEVVGALDHYTISSIGTQTAGTAFNTTITAQDINNHTVTNFNGTVDLTTTAGNISPATSGAFTNGIRNNQSVTVTGAGTSKIINVIDSGNTGAFGNSNTFTVNPGTKNKLTITTQPSASVNANTDLATDPVIAIQDQYGNIVSSDNSSVITRTVVLSTQSCGGTQGTGATTSTPPSSAAVSNGMLTYTNFQYSKSENIKICFASSGLVSALSNTITVNFIDLATGPITPISVNSGTATTLTAIITNAGNVSTVNTFTTLFQKANDPVGTGSADIGTDSDPALNGNNTTETTTLSYTFTTSGTTYIRACADKSSSGDGGIITEFNVSSLENNNCGPWIAITVTTTTAPMYPISDGDFKDWAPTGTTDVSAVADNSDSTYIDTSAITYTDTVGMKNSGVPSGSTIKSVTLYVRAKGTGTIGLVVAKDSNNKKVFDPVEGRNLSTNWSTYHYVFLTAGDGSNWSSTDIPSSGNISNSFGVQATASGAAQVSQMYIVVNYTTPVSSPSTSCKLGIEISYDGGTHWVNQKTQTLSTTMSTLPSFGGATDTWGRTWSTGDFSSNNFRVRVQDIDPDSNCNNGATTNLDSIQAQAYYTTNGVNAVAENADGDNFYIAPSSSDMAGIFADIGRKVCQALNIVPPPPPTSAIITVVTHVINDNIGTGTAGNFTMHVTGSTLNPSLNDFAGVASPGVSVKVDADSTPRSYSVDEIGGIGSYVKSIGGECSGTITAGQNVLCTITDDDLPQPPPPPPPPPPNIDLGSWKEF